MKTVRKRASIITLAIIIIIIAGLGSWIGWNKTEKSLSQEQTQRVQQALQVVESVKQVKKEYDVVVIGTDPEGVTAAISAARNGLKVLLVDGRNREILGGLMTLGWLNTLDLNYAVDQPILSGDHNFLNKGIFQEWYEKLEGTSFDTHTAANAFNEMVQKEPNIDLLMKTTQIKPIIELVKGSQAITGIQLVKQDGSPQTVHAKAVIDATQDGDIAAAAGVPFTWGHEDIGDPKSQMAVTLVLKLSGVTPEVWRSFANHKDTGIDEMSAWGFPEMKEYPSSNKERLRMRGLNIGLQKDDTILINSMQIFGVDPLDPNSVREGIEIGKKEAPLVVEYMKKNFKEFKNVQLAGTAPELYVRESRHIQGEYRLTMTDLLENRDQWDAIAYGSYVIDIQSTKYTDPGTVMMAPEQYGVPFRSLVPKQIDNLLVVGRAASFDSLPSGSARVIPLGMATAQAAGAAAKLSIEKDMTFRELSRSKADISMLRDRLIEQKMELHMYKFDAPDYTKHPAFLGLKAAASMFITSGGYANEWKLDEKSNPQRLVNNILNVRKAHANIFTGDPTQAIKLMDEPAKKPLNLEQAVKTFGYTMKLKTAEERTIEHFTAEGWITPSTLNKIRNSNSLTNGDIFMILRDVMQYYADITYE